MPSVLDKMLDDINRVRDLTDLSVAAISLSSPFCVVRLSDGQVGSAGNYAVQNGLRNYLPEVVTREYMQAARHDRLLQHTLRRQRSYVSFALRTAILSALSQKLLTEEVLAAFGLVVIPTQNWLTQLASLLKPGDKVLLIGFGGGLDLFVTSSNVSSITVCDYMFARDYYKHSALEQIVRLGGDGVGVNLKARVSKEDCREADLCCITGSALCNGSMGTLLELAKGCREIVVQGPSCSILPAELFRRGATAVFTTRKSDQEYAAASAGGDQIYDEVDRHYIFIRPVATSGTL